MTKRNLMQLVSCVGSAVLLISYLWFLLDDFSMLAFWIGCTGFTLAMYGFISYAVSEG